MSEKLYNNLPYELKNIIDAYEDIAAIQQGMKEVDVNHLFGIKIVDENHNVTRSELEKLQNQKDVEAKVFANEDPVFANVRVKRGHKNITDAIFTTTKNNSVFNDSNMEISHIVLHNNNVDNGFSFKKINGKPMLTKCDICGSNTQKYFELDYSKAEDGFVTIAYAFNEYLEPLECKQACRLNFLCNKDRIRLTNVSFNLNMDNLMENGLFHARHNMGDILTMNYLLNQIHRERGIEIPRVQKQKEEERSII